MRLFSYYRKLAAPFQSSFVDLSVPFDSLLPEVFLQVIGRHVCGAERALVDVSILDQDRVMALHQEAERRRVLCEIRINERR